MSEIDRAAAAVRNGELVVFPTETVYGLGANALSAEAVDRIYEAKGRPRTSPLIVHGADTESVRQWCTAWPESAQRLAECFWPGPLTLVLPKKAGIVDGATAGLPTVGLRVPAHPVALEFLRKAGVPVAAPSANPFTRLSPTRVEHVRDVFKDRVRWILDGGPSLVGIESTVLSLTNGVARLLRPGMISRRQIEAVIGPIDVAGTPETGAHQSPSQHEAHYQPRTPVFLYQPGASIPAIGRGVSLHLGEEPPVPGRAMPRDAAGYAQALFSTLHELDAGNWDWIAVELPPASPDWDGIHDRLRRAAAR